MLDEPKSEREWRARMDAETLAQAEKIKADKARHEEAQAQAKQMAEEKAEEKKAMDKVAGPKKRANSPAGTSGPSRQGNARRQPTSGTSGGQFNVFKRL